MNAVLKLSDFQNAVGMNSKARRLAKHLEYCRNRARGTQADMACTMYPKTEFPNCYRKNFVGFYDASEARVMRASGIKPKPVKSERTGAHVLNYQGSNSPAIRETSTHPCKRNYCALAILTLTEKGIALWLKAQ